MAITVTATQGGSTANGILLRVYVVTGAKPAAQQTGGALNLGFASNTNAWTGSITTTANSNVYGAASLSGSGNSPTATAVTIIDTSSDATNGETYVTFSALNVTAGATTRGINTSPATAGTLGAFEVLAATTLAEDASAPGSQPFTSTSGITVTSGSFTPVPGSLLVALVSSDGGAGSTTMTVSGGGLSWSQKTSNPAAGEDYAGVWMADVPAAAGGGLPAALPGRTWLRRFHHPQALPAPPPAAAAAAPGFPPGDVTQHRQEWPRVLISRGRIRFIPGPPGTGDLPPAALSRRQAHPRGFPRRGRATFAVPPQLNPPYPQAVLRQQRQPRGFWPVRGRRFEAVPPQQGAAAAPPYPQATIRQQRQPRGFFPRRGRATFAVPAQEQPVTELAQRRQAHPRGFPRRGRATFAVPAQLNPPYPTAELRQQRQPRGFFPVRGRRFEAVPPQQAAAAAPPYPWTVLRQWRQPRGFFSRRGHVTFVVPAQLNPPYPVTELAQRRQAHPRGFGRRGRVVWPPVTQAAAAPPAQAPPHRSPARAIALIRRRWRDLLPVPRQVNPPYPTAELAQRRETWPRGFPRRGRVAWPLPPPPPPPPFTVGALTAGDKTLDALTAATTGAVLTAGDKATATSAGATAPGSTTAGTLTAGDQRTGGPQ
jgi:hypothetical protein